MAIFNMEDSSLNEYLNEHGGAHRKIGDIAMKLANQKDSQSKYEKQKAKEYDDALTNRNSKYANLSTREKINNRDNHYKESINAKEYSEKLKKITKDTGTTKNLSNSTKHRDTEDIYGGKYTKDQLKKAYSDPNSNQGKALRQMLGHNSKTNNINKSLHDKINKRTEQKKYIQEAAEYILSVLDGIY